MKKYTLPQLHERCAKLLQKIVRITAADKNGYAYCATCNTRHHWKDMQGGHFIERGKLSTKLDRENIHPQCAGCNMWGMKKASVVLAYRRYMVDKYGEAYVQRLEIRARQIKKYTRAELNDMYISLKDEHDLLTRKEN